MFSNVIGSLTSLLPKTFIFASYVPILIFGFINLLLLYSTDPEFRIFSNSQIAAPLSLTAATAFVATIVAAYVLSSVNDFLREVLEGKHFPPSLESAMRSRQHRHLRALEKIYEDARDIAARLDLDQERRWADDLRIAAEGGAQNAKALPYDRKTDNAARSLSVFRAKLNRNLPFSYDDVKYTVDAMCETLRKCDITKDNRLEEDRNDLIDLIDYARNTAEDRELRAFTERQSRFGTVAEPTAVGNVAAAIASYTVTRYGIVLDTFLSRLIPVIQKGDNKAYGALLDAKTQLDFLVACFWLSAITWIGWFIPLALFSNSWQIFFVVATLGPVAAFLFYGLTTTNYLSYGQIIRASVDLNRFDLLDSLHIRQPSGIREEREIWRGLRELSAFGSEGVEFSYEEPKKST